MPEQGGLQYHIPPVASVTAPAKCTVSTLVQISWSDPGVIVGGGKMLTNSVSEDPGHIVSPVLDKTKVTQPDKLSDVLIR